MYNFIFGEARKQCFAAFRLVKNIDDLAKISSNPIYQELIKDEAFLAGIDLGYNTWTQSPNGMELYKFVFSDNFLVFLNAVGTYAALMAFINVQNYTGHWDGMILTHRFGAGWVHGPIHIDRDVLETLSSEIKTLASFKAALKEKKLLSMLKSKWGYKG